MVQKKVASKTSARKIRRATRADKDTELLRERERKFGEERRLGRAGLCVLGLYAMKRGHLARATQEGSEPWLNVTRMVAVLLCEAHWDYFLDPEFSVFEQGTAGAPPRTIHLRRKDASAPGTDFASLAPAAIVPEGLIWSFEEDLYVDFCPRMDYFESGLSKKALRLELADCGRYELAISEDLLDYMTDKLLAVRNDPELCERFATAWGQEVLDFLEATP